MNEARAAGVAATPRPPAEVEAAWAAIDQLYQADPTHPRAAGARAAAEWTLGHSSVSPITNVRQAPAGELLDWEGHTANMVVMGLREGDADFALGVMTWMFWWTGLEPLPAWVRVYLS